jgi:uncharacterized peroxidase-related enzyme
LIALRRVVNNDDGSFGLIRYAVKLTREPANVVAEDVETLREAGFTDLDILHIAEVVAYFAYANRIANGLGVPLEDWITET